MAENERGKNASASSRRASSWGGGKTPGPASSLDSGNCQGPSTGTTLLSGQLPAARVCCQGQRITRNCLGGQVSVPKGNAPLLLFNSRLVVGPRQPPIPLPPPNVLHLPPALHPNPDLGAESAAPSTEAMWARLPLPQVILPLQQGHAPQFLAPGDQPGTSQS